MKKERTNKVGRPRLADKKTIKESLFVCLFIIVVLVIIFILGFNTIKLDLEFSSASLYNVYNNDVNLCKINKTKVNCGGNVTYVKYKTNDNSYKEIYKNRSNISFDAESYDNIKVCFKSIKDNLKCVDK